VPSDLTDARASHHPRCAPKRTLVRAKQTSHFVPTNVLPLRARCAPTDPLRGLCCARCARATFNLRNHCVPPLRPPLTRPKRTCVISFNLPLRAQIKCRSCHCVLKLNVAFLRNHLICGRSLENVRSKGRAFEELVVRSREHVDINKIYARSGERTSEGRTKVPPLRVLGPQVRRPRSGSEGVGFEEFAAADARSGERPLRPAAFLTREAASNALPLRARCARKLNVARSKNCCAPLPAPNASRH
jgi:hypothetical protein